MGLTKLDRRNRIRNRIRKIVSGTSSTPRMSVYRSNKEIYAQLIDDQSGKTIVASSSRDKDIAEAKLTTKTEIASSVGNELELWLLKLGLQRSSLTEEGICIMGELKH